MDLLCVDAAFAKETVDELWTIGDSTDVTAYEFQSSEVLGAT